MNKKIESLSIKEAKKIILLSNDFSYKKETLTHSATLSGLEAKPIDLTLSAFENLGYIQIDTISVVERAHNHTLWTRNSKYENSHIDELIKDKKIFDYWSHAASYLPMKDYRYSLIRKNALKTGKLKHWYNKDTKLMNEILERIKNEGPLMVKDFENTAGKVKDWRAKPAKESLEYLFMQGDLMVPYRKKFHKVYDLPERVLPKDIDTTIPTESEYAKYLILRYLKANGIGQASEMAYLLKNTKPLVTKMIKEMLSNKEILEITVNNEKFYTLPKSLELLNENLENSQLKILSPFDNFLIQRKRITNLFNFDYTIECYVPKAKRIYGYFSLPILYGDNLVARMDCKVYRKEQAFHINHIVLEPSLKETENFATALKKELKSFMKFNNCDTLVVENCTPSSFKEILN